MFFLLIMNKNYILYVAGFSGSQPHILTALQAVRTCSEKNQIYFLSICGHHYFPFILGGRNFTYLASIEFRV